MTMTEVDESCDSKFMAQNKTGSYSMQVSVTRKIWYHKKKLGYRKHSKGLWGDMGRHTMQEKC